MSARWRGPAAVVALCGIPVILWALALPLASRFADLTIALRSLSVAAALSGAAAFAVAFVLGARLPYADLFFGGMDRLYSTHRATAIAALVLLVGHGTLLALGSALASLDGLLALVPPRAPWQVDVGLVTFVGLAAGVLLALRSRVRHEPFVWVMRAFGLVFLVGSVHVFAMPGTKAFSPALTAYLGLLTASALLAFAYRSLLADFLVPRRDYEVAEVHRLDASVMEVVLRPLSAPLRFEPGQFVYVAFRSASIKPEFHPFSITSRVTEPQLKLVVKALGDHTARLLRELQPGASAKVEGPYRGPYTHVTSRRQVWIAGGVGLTPFLGMARSFDSSEREIDLYYCIERSDQAHFIEELYAIADANPRLRVVPIRKDSLGFITAEDVAAATRDLPGKDILVAGPPVMLENLARQFRRARVPDAQIHYERFRFR